MINQEEMHIIVLMTCIE